MAWKYWIRAMGLAVMVAPGLSCSAIIDADRYSFCEDDNCCEGGECCAAATCDCEAYLEELAGEWSTLCQAEDGANFGFEYVYNFQVTNPTDCTGNVVVGLVTYNGSCVTPLSVDYIAGEFATNAKGLASSLVPVAVTVEEQGIKMVNEAAVTAANSEQLFGLSNWVLDEWVDLLDETLIFDEATTRVARGDTLFLALGYLSSAGTRNFSYFTTTGPSSVTLPFTFQATTGRAVLERF